jgi:hypothetical protein
MVGTDRQIRHFPFLARASRRLIAALSVGTGLAIIL